MDILQRKGPQGANGKTPDKLTNYVSDPVILTKPETQTSRAHNNAFRALSTWSLKSTRNQFAVALRQRVSANGLCDY
jgi:hypothetical protein